MDHKPFIGQRDLCHRPVYFFYHIEKIITSICKISHTYRTQSGLRPQGSSNRAGPCSYCCRGYLTPPIKVWAEHPGIAKTALSLSNWTAPWCICTEPFTLKPSTLCKNIVSRRKKNLRRQIVHL